jgi:multiple sugar transport system ATP-binding protein
VYYDPANLFVARFIGSPGMNLLEGKFADGVVHLPGGNQYRVPERWIRPLSQQLSSDAVILGFRPEAAHIRPEAQLKSEVYASDLHGAFNMLHLSLNGGAAGSVVHIRGERGGHAEMGEHLAFDLDEELVRFFNPQTETAILPEA